MQQGSDDPANHTGPMSPSTQRTVAIVDRSANVYEAATNVFEARFRFGGQSPYSPDIVLVNEFCIGAFLESAIEDTAKYLGRGSEASPKRSRGDPLLEKVGTEDGVRVVVSGSDWGIVQLYNR